MITLSACSGGSGGSSDDGTPSTNSRENNSQLPSGQNPSEPATGGGNNPATEIPDSTTPPPNNSGSSVSINWNAPSSREDGSPLTIAELSGYEIYFFMDGSAEEEGVIYIEDPATTEYSTNTLSSGTYYFAISSIDTNGLYSSLSDYYSITIP